MNPESVDKILNAMREAASKMGEGGMYAWKNLVRLTYIEGLTSLIVCGIVIVVATISLFWLQGFMKKLGEDREAWLTKNPSQRERLFCEGPGVSNDTANTIRVLSAVVYSLFIMVIGSCEVYQAIMKVAAPEAMTIKSLLHL